MSRNVGAYHSLARVLHPDKSSSGRAGEAFKRVKAAFDVLGTAQRRAAYDLERSGTPTRPQHPASAPANGAAAHEDSEPRRAEKRTATAGADTSKRSRVEERQERGCNRVDIFVHVLAAAARASSRWNANRRFAAAIASCSCARSSMCIVVW